MISHIRCWLSSPDTRGQHRRDLPRLPAKADDVYHLCVQETLSYNVRRVPGSPHCLTNVSLPGRLLSAVAQTMLTHTIFLLRT